MLFAEAIKALFSQDAAHEFLFYRYLLTLREEFNVTSVVDSLVQKGVISADAGTEVFRQGNIRSQIEMCLQEVSSHLNIQMRQFSLN